MGGGKLYDYEQGWSKDSPIIDCIAPNGDFNDVTAALAAVGLGDVPAWLRPFHYDIIDWLEPDWVFDTATGKYAGRYL